MVVEGHGVQVAQVRIHRAECGGEEGLCRGLPRGVGVELRWDGLQAPKPNALVVAGVH